MDKRGANGLAAILAAGALVAGSLVAAAQTAPLPAAMATPALPTLALEPAPPPSIWHGLQIGTELVATAGHGVHGFGGDVFASYDREFANNIVLGVAGSTGYLPAFPTRGFYKGADFAETSVRVGYDMGRLMPFVTAGVAVARPHLGVGVGSPGMDSLNLVLNGGGETRTLSRVGAGVDYAVTNDLTVGFAVSAVHGRGLLLP